MLKIISGKRYDTSKATLIGDAYGGNGKSDFRWYEEELYVTPRSKVYFLAGKGGPLSRWARKVDGGGWTDGSGIIPLSREDALVWAEQNLGPAEIEEHFGDMIEDA